MAEINVLPLLSLLGCDLQLPVCPSLWAWLGVAGGLWGVRSVMSWGPETCKGMKLDGFKAAPDK